MDLFDSLREKRLLLIDDDPWIRHSLSLLFESEGCRLLALETAEKGIEALREDDYHIIIVDYRLPGMDGLDFLRRIQMSHPQAIKVLITAYGSEDVVSEAASLGIHDFIEKPFTSKTIEKALSRLVQDTEHKGLISAATPSEQAGGE